MYNKNEPYAKYEKDVRDLLDEVIYIHLIESSPISFKSIEKLYMKMKKLNKND